MRDEEARWGKGLLTCQHQKVQLQHIVVSCPHHLEIESRLVRTSEGMRGQGHKAGVRGARGKGQGLLYTRVLGLHHL